MTYPSQPGYPTPQYGGQSPQQPQQNNLWLIGGAVVTVLIIIMTVILLVVQQTQDSKSTEGGGDGDPSTSEEGGDDGDDGGDDNGGGQATEMKSEACDAFDMASFEEAYGSFDPDQTYRSESTTDGLSSLSCSYYNDDYTSLSLRFYDYETADDAAFWVESDADYYNEENGYTYSEYTEYGDAGSLYWKEDTSTVTVYLHVAVGSLEITASTILYLNESVEQDAAIAAMEDLVAQSGDLFADYT